MNEEDKIDKKVACSNCEFEIPVRVEELEADENNLARFHCPNCGENITIDLGIPEEEE